MLSITELELVRMAELPEIYTPLHASWLSCLKAISGKDNQTSSGERGLTSVQWDHYILLE